MSASLLNVFYNTTLTVILSLALGCTFFLYARKRQVVFMAVFAIFSAYLLDNTIVFCTEVIPDFAELYDTMFLQTPSIKTVYFIVLIGSLLFALHSIIPAFSTPKMFLTIGVHAALLICVPMISQHDWMVFFYYFTTQFLVIGTSFWGLVALRNRESSFNRGMLKRILSYFLAMSILVLAEDSFVIFFLDRFSGPRMKIHNRNYSENLLYLGLALPILRYTIRQLKDDISATKESPVPEISREDRQQMDIYTFATAYNLTEREQEILIHLLQSKSQQEISDELIIALGTVKTHIHNIYQKTDSANRNQIIAKYRDFCDRRGSEAGSGKN